MRTWFTYYKILGEKFGIMYIPKDRYFSHWPCAYDFSSLVLISSLLPASDGNISDIKAPLKKYRPPISIAGLCIYIYHNNFYAEALFMHVWTVDWYGVLTKLFPCFLRTRKITSGIWNIFDNIYLGLFCKVLLEKKL